MDTGKTDFEQREIQMIAGQQDDEWQGTAIAQTHHFEHGRSKFLKAGLGSTLTCTDMKIVVVSGMLP